MKKSSADLKDKIKRMQETRVVVVYVIYKYPNDYPGKYVLRMFRNQVPAPKPTAVTDTVDGCRLFLPTGLTMIPPSKKDHPKIVETWL